MARHTSSGWIFDVYPSTGGMTVWLIDEESRAHCLRDALAASFFVAGSRAELRVVCEFIRAARLPVTLRRAERYDLFLRREIELLQVVVNDPARFPLIVQTVTRAKPSLTYYNCDVPLAQIYFYERHLFPLARVEVETDADHRVRAIQVRDSPWDLEYALPPLKTMTLRLEGAALNPNHGARGPLEIGVEDTTRVLRDDNPRELLIRVKELLERYDPDVIISAWGDSFILPRLLEMSRRYRVPLPLNREATRAVQSRPARSYFSYGRIVYKTASHSLFGRWHIDRENAFLIDDYGLDGTFELARITQVPVQQAARTSTGSGISAMEIATAYRRGILIPWQKREPEAWKSADELIVSDKGGLVFQPIVGLHEQVAELDFTSMFPTIMERFNISPETVNCPCCPNSRVPELGYSVCRQHRGLIPETLAPLIKKRSQYKKKVKALPKGAEKELYRRRVSCHKWLLVTCFGYLGYKNARFGKIEAHESVNAYGRDALLIAKEIAELRGFNMLHAIVDSLWLQKKNARDEEYDELTRAISEATQLPIELEGVYNWIAFLPSRQDPRLPVANRYFGAFRDGEVKIRGIEVRRSDTPPFIRRAQEEMIHRLATAANRAEFRERARDVLKLTLDYLELLRAGQIPFDQLVITQHLSRDPTDAAHTRNTLNAIVAKELLGRGVPLAPGESIRYVIVEQKAKAPSDRARALEHLDGSFGYDVEKYAELFLRSVTTLFASLGVTQPALEKYLGEWRAGENKRIQQSNRIGSPPQPDRPQLPSPQYALPLFTSHSSPLAKGRQRGVKMQVPSTTARELSECVR
jgi:DNA polymerase-2